MTDVIQGIEAANFLVTKRGCRTWFGLFCHRIEQVRRHDQSSADGSQHDRQQEKRSVSCSKQWPVQLRRSMEPARDVHFSSGVSSASPLQYISSSQAELF